MKGNAPDSERRFLPEYHRYARKRPRIRRVTSAKRCSRYGRCTLSPVDGQLVGDRAFSTRNVCGLIWRPTCKGKITLDEARELIAHFWIQRKPSGSANSNGSGDAQFYQNIILGGSTKDGNEVTNRLPTSSWMSSKSCISAIIRSPCVSATIRPRNCSVGLPRCNVSVAGIVSDVQREYRDRGLVQFGYPLEEAREFTNDGCWEAIIPGKTSVHLFSLAT